MIPAAHTNNTVAVNCLETGRRLFMLGSIKSIVKENCGDMQDNCKNLRNRFDRVTKLINDQFIGTNREIQAAKQNVGSVREDVMHVKNIITRFQTSPSDVRMTSFGELKEILDTVLQHNDNIENAQYSISKTVRNLLNDSTVIRNGSLSLNSMVSKLNETQSDLLIMKAMIDKTHRLLYDSANEIVNTMKRNMQYISHQTSELYNATNKLVWETNALSENLYTIKSGVTRAVDLISEIDTNMESNNRNIQNITSDTHEIMLIIVGLTNVTNKIEVRLIELSISILEVNDTVKKIFPIIQYIAQEKKSTQEQHDMLYNIVFALKEVISHDHKVQINKLDALIGNCNKKHGHNYVLGNNTYNSSSFQTNVCVESINEIDIFQREHFSTLEDSVENIRNVQGRQIYNLHNSVNENTYMLGRISETQQSSQEQHNTLYNILLGLNDSISLDHNVQNNKLDTIIDHFSKKYENSYVIGNNTQNCSTVQTNSCVESINEIEIFQREHFNKLEGNVENIRNIQGRQISNLHSSVNEIIYMLGRTSEFHRTSQEQHDILYNILLELKDTIHLDHKEQINKLEALIGSSKKYGHNYVLGNNTYNSSSFQTNICVESINEIDIFQREHFGKLEDSVENIRNVQGRQISNLHNSVNENIYMLGRISEKQKSSQEQHNTLYNILLGLKDSIKRDEQVQYNEIVALLGNFSKNCESTSVIRNDTHESIKSYEDECVHSINDMKLHQGKEFTTLQEKISEVDDTVKENVFRLNHIYKTQGSSKEKLDMQYMQLNELKSIMKVEQREQHKELVALMRICNKKYQNAYDVRNDSQGSSKPEENKCPEAVNVVEVFQYDHINTLQNSVEDMRNEHYRQIFELQNIVKENKFMLHHISEIQKVSAEKLELQYRQLLGLKDSVKLELHSQLNELLALMKNCSMLHEGTFIIKNDTDDLSDSQENKCTESINALEVAQHEHIVKLQESVEDIRQIHSVQTAELQKIAKENIFLLRYVSQSQRVSQEELEMQSAQLVILKDILRRGHDTQRNEIAALVDKCSSKHQSIYEGGNDTVHITPTNEKKCIESICAVQSFQTEHMIKLEESIENMRDGQLRQLVDLHKTVKENVFEFQQIYNGQKLNQMQHDKLYNTLIELKESMAPEALNSFNKNYEEDSKLKNITQASNIPCQNLCIESINAVEIFQREYIPKLQKSLNHISEMQFRQMTELQNTLKENVRLLQSVSETQKLSDEKQELKNLQLSEVKDGIKLLLVQHDTLVASVASSSTKDKIVSEINSDIKALNIQEPNLCVESINAVKLFLRQDILKIQESVEEITKMQQFQHAELQKALKDNIILLQHISEAQQLSKVERQLEFAKITELRDSIKEDQQEHFKQIIPYIANHSKKNESHYDMSNNNIRNVSIPDQNSCNVLIDSVAEFQRISLPNLQENVQSIHESQLQLASDFRISTYENLLQLQDISRAQSLFQKEQIIYYQQTIELKNIMKEHEVQHEQIATLMESSSKKYEDALEINMETCGALQNSVLNVNKDARDIKDAAGHIKSKLSGLISMVSDIKTSLGVLKSSAGNYSAVEHNLGTAGIRGDESVQQELAELQSNILNFQANQQQNIADLIHSIKLSEQSQQKQIYEIRNIIEQQKETEFQHFTHMKDFIKRTHETKFDEIVSLFNQFSNTYEVKCNEGSNINEDLLKQLIAQLQDQIESQNGEMESHLETTLYHFYTNLVKVTEREMNRLTRHFETVSLDRHSFKSRADAPLNIPTVSHEFFFSPKKCSTTESAYLLEKQNSQDFDVTTQKAEYFSSNPVFKIQPKNFSKFNPEHSSHLASLHSHAEETLESSRYISTSTNYYTEKSNSSQTLGPTIEKIPESSFPTEKLNTNQKIKYAPIEPETAFSSPAQSPKHNSETYLSTQYLSTTSPYLTTLPEFATGEPPFTMKRDTQFNAIYLPSQQSSTKGIFSSEKLDVPDTTENKPSQIEDISLSANPEYVFPPKSTKNTDDTSFYHSATPDKFLKLETPPDLPISTNKDTEYPVLIDKISSRTSQYSTEKRDPKQDQNYSYRQSGYTFPSVNISTEYTIPSLSLSKNLNNKSSNSINNTNIWKKSENSFRGLEYVVGNEQSTTTLTPAHITEINLTLLSNTNSQYSAEELEIATLFAVSNYTSTHNPSSELSYSSSQPYNPVVEAVSVPFLHKNVSFGQLAENVPHDADGKQLNTDADENNNLHDNLNRFNLMKGNQKIEYLTALLNNVYGCQNCPPCNIGDFGHPSTKKPGVKGNTYSQLPPTIVSQDRYFDEALLKTTEQIQADTAKLRDDMQIVVRHLNTITKLLFDRLGVKGEQYVSTNFHHPVTP